MQVYVSPYGWDVMDPDSFNAPRHSVSKWIDGDELKFNLVVHVRVTPVNVKGGFKEFFGIETKAPTYNGLVEIFGSINIKTGENWVKPFKR